MRFLCLMLLAGAGLAAAQEAPKISILTFTGPNCASCLAAQEHIRQLQQRHGSAISLLVKQLPENAAEARALAVGSTPTIFMNGKRFTDSADFSSLDRAIDLALGKLLAATPVDLKLDSAPRLGKAGLPEIVVFSDFQCPFCALLAPSLSELARNGEAAIRFKHFPLPFHTQSPAAHRAALAAGKQGKFWEMHDLIFASPGKLDAASLLDRAKQLNLNLAQFEQDSNSVEWAATIKNDMEEGDRIGVQGTPSVFVNGRAFLSRPTVQNLRVALKSAASPEPSLPIELPLQTLYGSAAAANTLEWFFDANSELTKASAATIRELLQRQPKDLRIVIRNLPMPFHPTSRITHQALALAYQQEKFWPFLDLILRQPAESDADRLKAMAMRAGLDLARFTAAFDTSTAASIIERDLARAQELSVRGVPTLVLNGKLIQATSDGRLPGIETLTPLIAATGSEGRR